MVHSDRLPAADYYDRDAAAFAARYDSVSFESVHPLLNRYLPACGQALDVGAGSGRDARAMTARGLTVTAVEPADRLRAIGSANSGAIRWIDDRLPKLDHLSGEAGHFDFILCCAVLMLVTRADLAPSLATMARLLAPKGRLALNLRAARTDDPQDLFFSHSHASIVSAGEAAGLACIDRSEADDAIGRGGYRWRSFVFEHRD